MALSDQVAVLERRLQAGKLTRDQFEENLAVLLRAASGSRDTTRPDLPSAGVGVLVGGPTPTHIGAYELVELLGQGGMGAVYLAKHILKPGLFAVKVPRQELLTQPGFGRRFRREASVGLKLDHPNIVRVHDLVIDGEWAAIVMEFVAGPNLETLLRNHGGPLPKERVLDLMIQVLDAMAYAHTEGVVHRDLKPKNLMMRPNGRVEVTDFGVAWLAGGEETQAGGMVGTAPYMAPELYTGARSIDHRADIYALGMTLYKLLVGQLPFPPDMTSYQVLRAKEDGMVPIPDHLPQTLQDVIIRAVHPDPDERFATCTEFKVALESSASEDWSPVTSVPVRLVHRLDERRRPQRQSAFQYAMVTLLIAVLGALTWLAVEVRRELVDTWAPTEMVDAFPTDPATPVDEPVSEPDPTIDVKALAATPDDDETEDTRQRPADDWTIAAVSGGGLPVRHTDADDLAVEPGAPVNPRRSKTSGSFASPTAAVEPATASPDPAVGGTVVRIPPAPRPEPADPEAGLMYLSATPDCRVFVDDRDYGTTEATRKGLVLEPGVYKVRFLCEDPICDEFRRRAGVKTLKVEAGKATRYVADFYALNQFPR